MQTRSPRVIRLRGRARLVTVLVATGLAVAVVPATAALAATSPGGGGVSAAKKHGKDHQPPAHPGQGKGTPHVPGPGHQEQAPPAVPGWELVSKLFTPAECSEHGHGPAWGQVLHGSLTLSTGSGALAVTAQEGTITALDATTVTVTSPDGFVLTWTLAADGHVFLPGHPDAFGSLALGQLVTVMSGQPTGQAGPSGSPTTSTSPTTSGTPGTAGTTGTTDSLAARLIAVRPCGDHPQPSTSPTSSPTSPSTSPTSPSSSPTSPSSTSASASPSASSSSTTG
ncbi:MAG TPA: hypothetical protein VFP72_17050 [Kineosporiaceae bacterium]|nr:hypothetical protein [Kineosporiaceae bacterium]